MSATTSRETFEQQQRQGALALIVLKVALAGCSLALVGTLGSVVWKVAGL